MFDQPLTYRAFLNLKKSMAFFYNEISIILIVNTKSCVLPHIYKFPSKQPCHLYIQFSTYIPC